MVPGVVSLVCEPVVFMLADRWPARRRWFLRSGLAAMAVAAFAAAAAPGPVSLALAMSLAWVATGTAASLGQATLVDARPDERGRTLARWTLLATAGDLAAPALLGVLAAVGLGWRAGFALTGAVLALWCLAMAVHPMPLAAAAGSGGGGEGSDGGGGGEGSGGGGGGEGSDGADAPGLWRGLRDALGDRLLLAWLLGVALCDLMDEILMVFASLHLTGDLGGGPLLLSATLAGFVLGGALGLLVLERLLRRWPERRLLRASALTCAAVYGLYLAAPSPVWAALALVLVGATAAPLYPLAAAQAYRLRPGRSGAVLAASHLFTPLGLALPFLLGALADHAGTVAALAMLVLQPLGLALLTAVDQ